jgi:hypothetical protein
MMTSITTTRQDIGEPEEQSASGEFYTFPTIIKLIIT